MEHAPPPIGRVIIPPDRDRGSGAGPDELSSGVQHDAALFQVAQPGITALNHMQTFMVLTFMASFLVTGAGTAATQVERWGGSAKGDTEEAIVWSGDDSYIAVSCGLLPRRDIGDPDFNFDDDSFYTSVGIYFTINRLDIPGNYIILEFDNNIPLKFEIHNGSISNIHNQCPSCMKNYNKIIDLFKKHKRVTVRTEDGKSAVFTLRGAAKVIPNCVYEPDEKAP